MTKADASLQENFKPAADSDAVVAIAKEAGLGIYADDLKKAQLTESSEEEMQGVTESLQSILLPILFCSLNPNSYNERGF